jgi:hypothetical protein
MEFNFGLAHELPGVEFRQQMQIVAVSYVFRQFGRQP